MLTLTITIPDHHAPRVVGAICRRTGHTQDTCPNPETCAGNYVTKRTAEEVLQDEAYVAEQAARDAAQPLDTSEWTVELGGGE